MQIKDMYNMLIIVHTLYNFSKIEKCAFVGFLQFSIKLYNF